ncbi:TRAP transporter substrate-binding protein [Roseospira navarrensis]|uniref:ABC transporter substrate-binding protein n=1 Tax=Roseospira navarrensis TaxID=140058 RepID=A0A7X1ZCX5_9PROT|nr:TRAP transporter substrate-binding protein [Roseospira navarrensis]MQX36253.1 ABC transporter substrate-binding protein [Roseospira navarrensis]
MKRREFLSGAAVAGAGAAASTLATPAIAQDMRELKMVTTWPKNFPGLGTSAERLAQRITAMSGGRLTVKVFAAGELVPPFEAFDAVSSGTADMYHGAEYYWQGKSKAFNFFAAVPFGLTATEMSSWIHHAGGQALWDELSSGFNIKPMMVANTGVQMGGWFNKEINSLEDYKGLKIRMPGLGGEVLRRIGAAAVSLPGGEIFPALQSGAIDATEWVGPWNDLAFGFYKVAKFYYYPGFHEPGTTLSGGVNLDVWNGLSSEDKAIIEAAATAENDYSLAEFNARNGDALDTLVNEHGVELRKFSDEVMTAIGGAAGEVVAEVAAEDPMTQKVYDSFLDFRTKAMGWARIADQAYWNARELPYEYTKG